MVIIGFVVGYAIGQGAQPVSGTASRDLRSQGYSFVNPILFGDFGTDITSPKLLDEEARLKGFINNYKSTGQLYEASVYYRDLKTGMQIVVNNEEKYNPASLIKLPLAMAYYKLAETKPELLNVSGVISFDQDKNLGQEIKPSESPVSGQSYSVQELISMMLKYSDNNSFNLLMTNAEAVDEMKKLFADIRLNYPQEDDSEKQIFTIKEYGRFYRVLYNATYLTATRSEQLVKLLSEVDYQKGIIAGIPNGVPVAHKFGLGTERNDSNELTGRQLHDCGIVYAKDNPYMLCIMTKSTTKELSSSERVLEQLSRDVYNYHVSLGRN